MKILENKAFIILDRSGSMNSRWEETIGALESYIEHLPKKTKVTLLVFDTEKDLVINNVPAGVIGIKKFFNDMDISPRGLTALFDAISYMQEYIGQTERAQITILTDGAENASKNTSKGQVKSIINTWKQKGYDINFIGADFDAFSEASNIGIGFGQTISYSSNEADNISVGATLAAKATSYYNTGATRDFTDEERKKFKG